MQCTICGNDAHARLEKGSTEYFECCNCKLLFCEPLSQDDLVGGGAEVERNTQQNHLRIERIGALLQQMNISKEDAQILDWGAGHGYLVGDLKKAGFLHVYGYDPYNPEFDWMPTKDRFHIVTSVEVFEHFSAPFHEMGAIRRTLKGNGRVYVETGFLNAAWEDGLPLEENPYVNPEAGHSTIWTHHALDLAMVMRGFMTDQRFNRHALVYKKVV
jgi:hypothetical protein